MIYFIYIEEISIAVYSTMLYGFVTYPSLFYHSAHKNLLNGRIDDMTYD